MKTTRTSVARLLPLLAILALLPFATACEDAGDEPAGPTGAGTSYNPVMDASGASIAVKTKDESIPGYEYQGGDFALLATLKGGDGKGIQGVPLTVQAETGTGDITKFFSFDVNPSITNASGLASFEVIVAANCPPGSYRFVVKSSPGSQPVSGPTAMGFAGIKVIVSGEAAITGVSIVAGASSVTEGDTASYIAGVSATGGCTPIVQISFGSSYADAGADLSLDHTWNDPGVFFVRARARCSEDPVVSWVESAPYQVTVTALAP